MTDVRSILANVDRANSIRAEVVAQETAEHERRNRLYHAAHQVETFVTEGSVSDAAFCKAWATRVVAFAKVMEADGWFEKAGEILAEGNQACYVWAILETARKGDGKGTTQLLEEACNRGDAMAGAGGWLRGRLYRELIGMPMTWETSELESVGPIAEDGEHIEPSRTAKKIRRKRGEMEALAIGFLAQNRDWNNEQFAQAIGCHPKSLTRERFPKFFEARDRYTEDNRRERGKVRGAKYHDTGMEAYEDE